MPLPEDIDGLSPAELKLLVVRLLEEVADLRRTVAAQRDEIARLKGGPGRPNIKPNSKPSGMEQATDPKPPGGHNERRRRGSTRAKLTINEERKVKLPAPPPGARFKGYTSFVVQDLVLHPHVIDFKCERWQTADGKVVTAPLPEGLTAISGRNCAVSCSPNIIRDKPRRRGCWRCCAALASTFPNASWSAC